MAKSKQEAALICICKHPSVLAIAMLSCTYILTGCSTTLVYKLPDISGVRSPLVDERKDEFKHSHYYKHSAATRLGDENFNPEATEYIACRIGQSSAGAGDLDIKLRSLLVLIVAPLAHREASGGVVASPFEGAIAPVLNSILDPVYVNGLQSDFVYVFILVSTKNGDVEARARIPFHYYIDMPECRNAVREAIESATGELVQRLDALAQKK